MVSVCLFNDILRPICEYRQVVNGYFASCKKITVSLTFLFILNFLSLISGFRRDVDDICGLLGYYAASCGNCLPTFRDNVWVPSSRVKSPEFFLLGLLIRQDGTDTLSRNVGKQLPHDAASYPRRAQISP
jgi:hypothetical protein